MHLEISLSAFESLFAIFAIFSVLSRSLKTTFYFGLGLAVASFMPEPEQDRFMYVLGYAGCVLSMALGLFSWLTLDKKSKNIAAQSTAQAEQQQSKVD